MGWPVVFINELAELKYCHISNEIYKTYDAVANHGN
jgi:hypothetical protein